MLCKEFAKLCNFETELGEPQWYHQLNKGRILEVTHEEFGLSKENQFYSCRVHCSDKEYADGYFRRTLGIIDIMVVNDEDFDAENILRWANAVANNC